MTGLSGVWDIEDGGVEPQVNNQFNCQQRGFAFTTWLVRVAPSQLWIPTLHHLVELLADSLSADFCSQGMLQATKVLARASAILDNDIPGFPDRLPLHATRVPSQTQSDWQSERIVRHAKGHP